MTKPIIGISTCFEKQDLFNYHQSGEKYISAGPFGLTTTDPELKEWVHPDWGAQRVGNLYISFQWQLRDILRRLGLTSISDLRGRRDLLRYIPEEFEA